AIRFVTQSHQNGFSLLIFETTPLMGYAIDGLFRIQGIKGWRNRRPSRSCSARPSSWPQRVCPGPRGLLRDHCDQARVFVSGFDRLGTTFSSGSTGWRSVHCDYCLAEERSEERPCRESV